MFREFGRNHGLLLAGAVAYYMLLSILPLLILLLVVLSNVIDPAALLATLAPIVLVAVGQAIVVLFGGIDLSVGATAGLATVVLSLAPLLPGGAPSALLMVLVTGLIAGVANGLGVVAGVNPLLMTFATAGVFQGSALLLQDLPGARVPAPLLDVLSANLGPIPVLSLVATAVCIGAWLWIGQSRAGKLVMAAGYDPRIAARLGFPVGRIALVVYGLSGVLASLGGLAIATRTYTADALVGGGVVIDSIATVLVAGIVITGGVGSLLSVLPAAVVLAVVGQIVTLTGIDASYQTIFKGVLLVAAMGAYALVGGRLRLPSRLRAPAFGGASAGEGTGR